MYGAKLVLVEAGATTKEKALITLATPSLHKLAGFGTKKKAADENNNKFIPAQMVITKPTTSNNNGGNVKTAKTATSKAANSNK